MPEPIINLDISPIRLSELSGRIREVISQAFSGGLFWVIADVTNHTYYSKKNVHYFDLSESEGQGRLIVKIQAAAFGRGSQSIELFERVTGQRFTSNICVLAKVEVSFHEVYGLKLNLLDLDSNFTLGALEQQRQETLSRLVAENPGMIDKRGDEYITHNKRLVLPKVIQRIAFVASKSSAGYEDFRHTVEGNQFGYRFEIDDYHTSVQGDLSENELVNTLIAVFNSGRAYDAVVIARGGGTQTDFLIFDQYRLGKAIARFPVPIITGIGHQRNETIADLMAHTQTKTPTKSAEFILQHNRAFEDAILLIQKNILIHSQRLFSDHFQRLAALNSSIMHGARSLIAEHNQTLINNNRTMITRSASLIFGRKNDLISLSARLMARPQVVLYSRKNDIDTIISNLKSFTSKYLALQRGYLGHHVSMVKVMAPDNILKRGFALVLHKGKLAPSADTIELGSEIEVILDGTNLRSTVKQKTKHDGREFNL